MSENQYPSLLGILGGLGPMSGIYFCEMLTQHTYAQKDSDHLNFILSSRADTPDRSSFILGQSSEDPTPRMRSEAKRLEAAGAELLVIPCNTAHYFYSKVAEAVDIPILNIIEETAKLCAIEKIKKVDQKIIANVGLAYDDKLGFLTSCPTNVGTGMRASVMMFLPSLTKTGKIQSLIKALDQKRMTVPYGTTVGYRKRRMIFC